MAWITVLGIPAAIYVASITALLFHLLEKPMPWFAAFGSGLFAIGIYTLHRSTIQQSEHMQKRHLLAVQHSKLLLTISLTTLIMTALCFLIMHEVLLILMFGAVMGILAYGRKTIIKPLRTFTFLKPLEVGGGIAFFAWFYLGMPENYIPVLGLFFICTADALLCDLDDRRYDASTGCSTLANELGTVWTWIVSFGLYGIALSCLYPPIGVLFVLFFPIPLLLHAIDLRFLVDVRPALVLLIAWVL